jgi:hypothetical protein
MQVGTTWQPVAKIFFAMANGPTQAILSVREALVSAVERANLSGFWSDERQIA